MDFKRLVKKQLGIVLTDKQSEQLERYYEALIDYNMHTNLTAITQKDDVYIKHFLDSMMLSKVIKKSYQMSLCDMGAGAGFPSLPLKIILPDLKVTIVDSLGKRIKFLNALVETLDLKDVTLVHARAEVFAGSNQKVFDYVTARALGHFRFIFEMGVPMLKSKGLFIAMKSVSLDEELSEAKDAINTLKLSLLNQMTYNLPALEDQRHILVFKKESHVGGFPRPYSIMKKKPL